MISCGAQRIATQNPLEQSGTFPLPESQLDRFLMRLSLGYPSAEYEKQLLRQKGSSRAAKSQEAVFTPQEINELFDAVEKIHVSDAIIDYLQTLISKTRSSGAFINGLSPRAGLQGPRARIRARGATRRRRPMRPH